MADSLAPWISADDIDLLEDIWIGALEIEPEARSLYLEAARDQCLAFLGRGESEPLALPDPLPRRYLLAQALQAKALSLSAYASQSDSIGGPIGEGVTVFPMDWKVKNLLRPTMGVSIA